MAQDTHALLFDVDGTLIDTYHLYLESYRRALAPHLGYAPADEEILARRPSSERRFLSDWVGDDQAAACHARLCEHYEELHGALCEGLYEGVREMLAHLRSVGIPVGVVTGKGRRAWQVTRSALHLPDFDVVVTDDDVDHPKPHPAGLLAALEVLRVDPAAAVYIGDSASDLQAGRAAGVRVGAALWPKTAPGERDRFVDQILALQPDWLLERPADVSRVFAPWC